VVAFRARLSSSTKPLTERSNAEVVLSCATTRRPFGEACSVPIPIARAADEGLSHRRR
jgi:hypothetical protein